MASAGDNRAGAHSSEDGRREGAWRLAPDVHVCTDREIIIVLDICKDRYSLIRADTAHGATALTRHLQNASHAGEESSRSRLLRGLRDKGLIEPGAAAGARFTFVRPTLSALGAKPEPRATLPDAARIIAACSRARARLQRGLGHALCLCAADRRAVLTRGVTNNAMGEADAGMLARAFESARPFYPKDRVCLFDSLALARFLARRAIAVDVVFGVKTRPFQAHCWVQRNDIVLNDDAERAASFIPIFKT